jgi:hypothetical protein
VAVCIAAVVAGVAAGMASICREIHAKLSGLARLKPWACAKCPLRPFAARTVESALSGMSSFRGVGLSLGSQR